MNTKKAKFNVVDVFIIIALIALVCAAIWLCGKLDLFGDSTSERDSVKLKYVVEVSMLDEQFSAILEKNDRLFNSRGTIELGYVRSCEVRDSDMITVNASGEPVISVVEGKKDLYITVEAEAYIDGGSYYVNGLRIGVGEYIEMMTPELTCGGYCISFEEIKR